MATQREVGGVMLGQREWGASTDNPTTRHNPGDARRAIALGRSPSHQARYELHGGESAEDAPGESAIPEQFARKYRAGARFLGVESAAPE